MLSCRHEILYPIAQRHFHTLRPRLGNCHFILMGNYWFSQLLGGILPFLAGWGNEANFHGRCGRRADTFLISAFCCSLSTMEDIWITLLLFCEVPLHPSPTFFIFQLLMGKSFLTPEFLFSKLFWLHNVVLTPKNTKCKKLDITLPQDLHHLFCNKNKGDKNVTKKLWDVVPLAIVNRKKVFLFSVIKN